MGAIAIGSADAQAQEVSAQQRKAAAEAYDRGTSAWLAGQYGRAAQWFETAHRLAPSPAALVQAIRSHSEAGNSLRAASLSLWLDSEYDDDPRASKVADGILKEAEGNYALVEVECDEDCSIDVDGKVQEYERFYVEPSVEHTVTAGFQHGDQKETVKGEPGETVQLRFEAPPPPPEPEPGTAEAGPDGAQPADEPWPGFPKWVTITAIGVSLGLAGVAVWSGIDTLNARDNYEEWAALVTDGDGEFDCSDPATCNEVRSLYDEGQDLERRTNILIGVAGGVAALTAVTAIFFTDWKGSSSEEIEEKEGPEVTAGMSWQPGGGMAVVEGRF
ncbi:MAG: hypothetical protein ACODAU_04215 [Myxococcota bacterium]